jgi:hypothetical protein
VTLYRKETLQCHIHLFRLLRQCDTFRQAEPA